MTTKRRRVRRISAMSSSGVLRFIRWVQRFWRFARDVQFAEYVQDAITTFAGIVEKEVKLRSELQHDAPRKLSLQVLPCRVQCGHACVLLLGGADHAHPDLRVLEVRRDIDFLYRHQLGR